MGRKPNTPEKLLKNFSVDHDTGCWNWLGWCDRDGYGHSTIKDKNVIMHRVSYEYYKGQIEEGNMICHSCDNPSCINPEHLWQGTHIENNNDKVKKRRHIFGEKHHKSKLTEEDVLYIKDYLEHNKEDKGRVKFLADKFQVSIHTIYYIDSGKNWNYLVS